MRTRRVHPTLGIALLALSLAAVASPARGAGLTTLSTFEGVSLANVRTIRNQSPVPPDANLAVGISHVFQLVDGVGRITDKPGNLLSQFSLATFFGVEAGFEEADPRVIYDAQSGRWFATYTQFSLARATSSILLAVSATSDPTGSYCRYHLDSSRLQVLPILGVSDDKVVIAYQAYEFTGSQPFVGTGYHVIAKASLLTCGDLSVTSVPPDLAHDNLYPAQSLTSTGPLFVAGQPFRGDPAVLTVLTVNGVPGSSTVTTTPRSVAIRDWVSPPDAVQPGTTTLLGTDDNRVRSAAWQNGSLWVAGHEACVPAGDFEERSCLRVIEVRTDTGTVRQDITYGTAGEYYYYPALRPDSAGNVVIVFIRSSASHFAGVRVTFRLATDPLGTLQPSTDLHAGAASQTEEGSVSTGVGDYSGAAVDGFNPLTVWVTGEYFQANGDWGTVVAAVTAQSNPLEAFVTGFYQSVLDRTPSFGELAAWTAFLTANPTPASASGLAHTFLDGPEYLSRPVTQNGFVTLLYHLFLDRAPDAPGLAGWTGFLQQQFDSALPGFVNSAEFQALLPDLHDAAAVRPVVTRLYQNVLARTPAADEVNAWTGYIVATGDVLGTARGFFDSAEYNATPRTLAAHVVVLYRTFLGREPSFSEVGPWVDFLQAFRSAMEDSFIASPEFQAHFQSLFP